MPALASKDEEKDGKEGRVCYVVSGLPCIQCRGKRKGGASGGAVVRILES